jgi:hypothetical protein
MTFSFSEIEVEVLKQIETILCLGNTTWSDRLRGLMADGGRWRMVSGQGCGKRIAPADLEDGSDEWMIGAYLDFLDAIAQEVGVMGRGGQPPKFHFVQYPAGGWWEASGRAGWWAVLPLAETLTPNGTLRNGVETHGDPGHLYRQIDPEK